MEVTHVYNRGAPIGPALNYTLVKQGGGKIGIGVQVRPSDRQPDKARNTEGRLFHAVYDTAADNQFESDGRAYVMVTEESMVHLIRRNPGYGSLLQSQSTQPYHLQGGSARNVDECMDVDTEPSDDSDEEPDEDCCPPIVPAIYGRG